MNYYVVLTPSGSRVVSLCSNLSYRYDHTNVADAGETYRSQGEKQCLFGNKLLASLMYEEKVALQFGVHSHIFPFLPVHL